MERYESISGKENNGFINQIQQYFNAMGREPYNYFKKNGPSAGDLAWANHPNEIVRNHYNKLKEQGINAYKIEHTTSLEKEVDKSREVPFSQEKQTSNIFYENEYDNFITKAGKHDPEDIIIEVEKGSIPENAYNDDIEWSYGKISSKNYDKIPEKLVEEMAEKLVEEMADNPMTLDEESGKQL